VNTSVTITIRRPLEDVFRYYLDPANRPRWSDHVLSGSWVNDKPVGVGAIFQITLRQWGRVLCTEREITEYEANEKMCYELNMNVMRVHSCQTFEARPEGTKFTIQAEMQPKGWLRLIFPLIARGQAKHLQEEAANLKAALEAIEP
jgi:uncharacterized membrane protein